MKQFEMAATLRRFVCAGIILIIFGARGTARAETCTADSSIQSNFNGTAVPSGDTIWFTSVLKVGDLHAGATVRFDQATIAFTADGVTHTLDTPKAVVTFSPTATTTTTTFNAATGTWETTAPLHFAGNVFLDGFALPLTTKLPGGVKPVTWSGRFTSDQPGLSVHWLWAAAAYTSFSTDYGTLGVKPVDDNHADAYQNSDHAGTPENFKKFVTGGARGGGGSNFTGSLSGTASADLTCVDCVAAADCDDRNGCTTDTCDAGTCNHAAIAGCQLCTTAADCNDGGACTDDLCNDSGVCAHHERPGCVPCRTAADCNDGNPCTDDQCAADGSCAISAIPGCRRCNAATECDDHDACTTDTCTNGVCANTTIQECRRQTQEICGNCIDDDHNGLTDFEDPACCMQSNTVAMTVKQGRLRPRGGATRLRLRTLLAHAGLKMNPLTEDVFLQIRPEGGTDVFCARIPAGKFLKRHRAFKFSDRRHTVGSALGLDGVKIKVRPDGSVRLRAGAKRAQLTCPFPGRLQVTVGFRNAAAGDGANRCSSTIERFHAGRRGRLIAP